MQPEQQPNPAAIDRLTETLFDLAGYQGVRVIEALAAVLTRRGLEQLGRPSGLSEPAAARPYTTLADDEDAEARRAICRRIARRALRGSLIDPTRGATAMHRIDDVPAWSHDHLPIGMFGPFLFYRLTPEQLASAHDSQGADVWDVFSPQALRSEGSDPCWWPDASEGDPDWMAS